MALLSLFAAVGISFVIYAEMVATSAKYNREAVAPQQPDVDPELFMNYFLSQFIYDTDNVYSAMRGHSLARSLYGWNDGGQNSTPFNGLGRPHFILPDDPLLPLAFDVLANKDDFPYLNYTRYPDAPQRNPEYYGGQYRRIANVPYTYADHNNVFLAAVDADGQVLVPSYRRSWLEPASTDPSYKFAVLWPDPSYHVNFPAPNQGGHVKNLDSSPGTKNPLGGHFPYDSYWIDPGFPVLRAKDGRKYKPLVAVLAVDLDGKINVNAAGSVRGPGNTHSSSGGYGPWEINISKVLKQADWSNILTNTTLGRYGSNGIPGSGLWTYNETAPLYSKTDLDGIDTSGGTGATTRMSFPGEGTALGYLSFPTYPAGYDNASAAERTNHPALYNPIYPNLSGDAGISVSHIEALLRYGGTGSPALASDLFSLSSMSFNNDPDANAKKRARMLLTPLSNDLGQPGASPGSANYNLPAVVSSADQRFPRVTPAQFPDWLSSAGPAGSEYSPDWGGATRAVQFNSTVAKLGHRLLINRELPAYPAPDGTGRIDLSVPAIATKFDDARIARSDFAKDLFCLLRWVNLGKAPSQPITVTEENRWLAQLAVNIVDYRDSDDNMTPFEWATGEWVYGTEIPKLVINEAYSVVVNDPADITAMTLSQPYQVNYWIELLNPMPNDPSMTVRLQVPNPSGYAVYKLVISKPAANLFVDQSTGTPVPGDVLKEISSYQNSDPMPAMPAIDTDLVYPVDVGQYSGPSQQNKGFYVLGPVADFPSGPNAMPMPDPALPKATLRSTEMTHTIPNTSPLTDLKRNVFLRRLACPGLPPQDTNPALATYNPYVTVDYMQNFRCWDGVKYDNMGPHTPATALDNTASIGRRQPYAGDSAWQAPQKPDKDPATAGTQPYVDQPQHTFFSHNGAHGPWDMMGTSMPASPGSTLHLPFDWLVHLDRKVASPMELLHVNCFKPYELTQFFMATGPITDASNPVPNAMPPHPPIVITTAANHRLYTGAKIVVMGVDVIDNMTGSPPVTPPPAAEDPNGTWTITVLTPTTFSLNGSNGNPTKYTFTPNTGRWGPNKFAHQAPWLATNGGLYRLFEYLDAGHRASGVSLDGRIPGLVNVNTADWYKNSSYFETALAISDPQAASSFQAPDVEAVFKNLMKSRAGPDEIVGTADDQPFRSLATGAFSANAIWPISGAGSPYTNPSGLGDTLLRAGSPQSPDIPLLGLDPTAIGSDHPWRRYELLSKLFNNVTTRSNVFAVWVTVGFFEVLDENARPVKLGPEIGFAQNRHIRHRMFAIIDRSQLRIQVRDRNHSTQERLWKATGSTPIVENGTLQSWNIHVDNNLDYAFGPDVTDPAGGTADGNPDSLVFTTLNGRKWILQHPNSATLVPGTVLTLDPNTADEETVVVDAITTGSPPQISVQVRKSHGPTSTIICRGNMGPWSNADFRYDMRKDTDVVRYFSVIK